MIAREEFILLSREIRAKYPGFSDAGKICCEYYKYFQEHSYEELRSEVVAQIEHEIQLSARLRSKALRP